VSGKTPLPEWADPELSAGLPSLCRAGEGPHLDFKEQFPQQADSLGKHIAAFATADHGILLIGVDDAGVPVGLAEAWTPSGRDLLLARLQGVCKDSVRPAVRPTVKFAVVGTAAVMVVDVRKDGQPVYYWKGTPYIRHLAGSRPANPHEVISLVEGWLARRKGAGPGAYEQFLTHLAGAVTDVRLFAADLDARQVNPAYSALVTQYASAARRLRELSLYDEPAERGVTARLLELAAATEAVARHRSGIGHWPAFTPLVEEARRIADDLYGTVLLTTAPSEGVVSEATREAKLVLRRAAQQCQRLLDNDDVLCSDRERSHLARLGFELAHFTGYGLSHLGAPTPATLWDVAVRVHTVGTYHLAEIDGPETDQLRLHLRALLIDLGAVLESSPFKQST
jgi:hypothetical protein